MGFQKGTPRYGKQMRVYDRHRSKQSKKCKAKVEE